jgi:tRNA (guanine10-N2)-dimethyltransferase
MMILFEVSGEHPNLPIAEITALLNSQNIVFKVREKGRVFVIDAPMDIDKLKEIAFRLALSFRINELFYRAKTKKNLLNNANKIFVPPGTFRVRGKKIGDFNRKDNLMSIEKELGAYIAKSNKVDLETPDTEIRILLTNKFYVCRKLFDIERRYFEQRRVIYRPFFSPISLHPRIARALVNLSGIKKGEKILDPFCGTGGILLEAGMIGAHVFGSDIDKKMVQGCKKTLGYYGINPDNVFQMDIGKIGKIGKVDGVVSDFPYGRSTRINRKLEDLYDQAFENIWRVLKKNKQAVVGLPTLDSVKIADPYLQVLNIYPYWVHKSLTRYFVVFSA